MAKTANGDPQPVRGDRGATILGPRNVPLVEHNYRPYFLAILVRSAKLKA
jgi:hypothetical protein